MKSKILFLLLMFAGNYSYAVCSQTGNELIGWLGLDGGTGTIYTGATSVSNQCGCGSFRFRPENADADKALSILMAARLAGHPVRIDILNDDDCDTAFRVYIENK